MTTYTDSPSPTDAGSPAAPPEPRPDARPDARAAAGAEAREHRRAMDALKQVRASDLEPYTGLGYLSKLFRLIAILLLLLMVAEVATGLVRQGSDAIPTLVAEASRLIVLAGLLWGIGDLAILLIDVGHDVRAARILLARATAHAPTHPPTAPPRDGAPSAPSAPPDAPAR